MNGFVRTIIKYTLAESAENTSSNILTLYPASAANFTTGIFITSSRHTSRMANFLERHLKSQY